jgi:hypothetical protein
MIEKTLRKKNANRAVDPGNEPSMKIDGNKSKNSRCKKCKLAVIRDLLQKNNELEKLLQSYRSALLEADRQNTAMQQSGLLNRKYQ